MRVRPLLVTLLILVWAALSGHYSTEPLVFFLAVLSLLLVLWLVRRMNRTVGETLPAEPIGGMALRLPRYLLFLAREILTANLHVARLVLAPTRDLLSPRLLKVRARQRGEVAQVIHANSITLTPGTVTLDLRDGVLLVHAIGPVAAGSVVSGAIDRAVTRLEQGS